MGRTSAGSMASHLIVRWWGHRCCSRRDISCAGANSIIDLPGRAATIDLAIGEAAECIFDNSAFATVTIDALSVGGTDTFGFTASGTGVSAFSVTTTRDSTKAGHAVRLGPGRHRLVHRPGRAQLATRQVSCFGTAGSVDWVIAGPTVTIALAEGNATECIYYYRLSSGIIVPPIPPLLPPAGVVTPIPVLDPRMLLILILLVVACAAWTVRRR